MAPDAPNSAGWEPTEEDRLLLQALLLPGPAAQDAWRAWSARVPLEDIRGAAFLLLPQLYQALLANHINTPDLPRLKGISRKNWYENQLRRAALAAVIGALSQAGVQTLLLSGALAAAQETALGQSRHNSDLACAVPLAQVPAALDVIGRLGWRPVQAGANPQRHWHYRAGMVFRPAEGDLSIQLLWRLAPVGAATPIQAPQWQRSQPVNFDGQNTLALDMTDQLWLACATGAVWRAQPDWRWLVDAVRLIRAGQIDWRRLVETSRQSRTTRSTHAALSYLATILQAPIPAEALSQLQATSVSPPEALLFELTSRPPRRLDAARKHWRQYQTRANGSRSLAGFLHYLEAEWALESSAQVLLAAAQRALKRLA